MTIVCILTAGLRGFQLEKLLLECCTIWEREQKITSLSLYPSLSCGTLIFVHILIKVHIKYRRHNRSFKFHKALQKKHQQHKYISLTLIQSGIWAGHVVRLYGNTWTKRLVIWRPISYKSIRGEAPIHCTDDIK